MANGHVTQILLLATLVPIIKDKLGSINVSKNYRSIAISSILLKLIDWIFIILFGCNFGLNDLPGRLLYHHVYLGCVGDSGLLPSMWI